jgi:hypothetical protein
VDAIFVRLLNVLDLRKLWKFFWRRVEWLILVNFMLHLVLLDLESCF